MEKGIIMMDMKNLKSIMEKGLEKNLVGKNIIESQYINYEVISEIDKPFNTYNYIGDIFFEGEFKDGERWNGKGVELNDNDNNLIPLDIFYSEGKIIQKKRKEFKVEFTKKEFFKKVKIIIEFKDGFINPIGKEISFDGKLLYKGEYSNEKRNGKGKEYNSNGELIFEGEFKDGKKWNRKRNKFKK